MVERQRVVTMGIDMIRSCNARKAMGLVVEVLNKKEVKVKCTGKGNQLRETQYKHRLEVIG